MGLPGRVGGAGARAAGAGPGRGGAAQGAGPVQGATAAPPVGNRGVAWPPYARLDTPRTPQEVKRGRAAYTVTSCTVRSEGMRLEVSFPGVSMGVFSDGQLRYTIYRGTNLIRQEIAATTREDSVAYKYDAGLRGLPIQSASRLLWRDTSNVAQEYQFGGARNAGPVPLRTSNRLLVAANGASALAVFPPPHSFFWSREISINLGYSWYQKDTDSSFALGIRQADQEDESEDAGNFALYSARPGTEQRMPIYLYPSATTGEEAMQGALAFTRQDKYKPLPGHVVMATHFHTGPLTRLNRLGGLDNKLGDFELARGAGINVFAPIGAGGGGGGQGNRLKALSDYYEMARRHSDKNFLIMPNEEGDAGDIGGHNDVLISKPVFWDYDRPAGRPFVETSPQYGKVYHVGGPLDMMELARLENMLVYMPHPRSKGSTGYPDAIKDSAQFNHANYRGIGMRWGMGLDGSETRLCEYRCQTLLDDMNNWVADRPGPLKFVQAITETYENRPGDDFYANSPVNYVKVATMPTVDNWAPIIDAMKRGDYFWSSGEVLIPSYSIQGNGPRRTIVADVEWTFPLAFVEVVWGDGTRTERQVISAADLPPFGKKRFEIPFNVEGKKWIRFAAWDTATNGAMVMPVRVAAQ
jgi:hypothetical protein